MRGLSEQYPPYIEAEGLGPRVMSCPATGHSLRAWWLAASRSGRPVVGISFCSLCLRRATVADHILWKRLGPPSPYWRKKKAT